MKFFKDAFDWSEAEQSGRIIPHEGCDSDYDAVCKTISEVESGLMKHLNEQRKLLGNSSVQFWFSLDFFIWGIQVHSDVFCVCITSSHVLLCRLIMSLWGKIPIY